LEKVEKRKRGQPKRGQKGVSRWI